MTPLKSNPFSRKALGRLLKRLAAGEVRVEEALEQLAALPFPGEGETRLDHHRDLRCGFPEVIFAQGKTSRQVAEAAAALAGAHARFLATRASAEQARSVQELLPEACWNEAARTITWRREPPPPPEGKVCVVAAGTSDLPVLEEAASTLEIMDVGVDRLVDVGVAGIHRLLVHIGTLRAADALVVCAGMEGALPSVIGGLVEAPVIAVPTSVGYGASFGGLTALLAMMNSCAPGVGVVNIDNGFGGAVLAGRIARAVSGLSRGPEGPKKGRLKP